MLLSQLCRVRDPAHFYFRPLRPYRVAPRRCLLNGHVDLHGGTAQTWMQDCQGRADESLGAKRGSAIVRLRVLEVLILQIGKFAYDTFRST